MAADASFAAAIICSSVGSGAAEFDVIFNRVPEQIHILEHHADIFQQTIASKFAEISVPPKVILPVLTS